MSEHQSASKKNEPAKPQALTLTTQGSDGDFAAPINMPTMAVGRSHKEILQLQRSVGNRTTQRLLQRDVLQREGGPDGAAAPVPAVAPAPAAAGPINPMTVVLSSEDYTMCEDIYKATPNWNDLKSKFIDTAPDHMLMAKLWMFRRTYVVNLIKSLRSEKYPNLLAKSAGSKDLASDYDITVASPGNDNDVKAIDDFNNYVKTDFDVQPGTLFDTNLYAKDYGAIAQSEEFADPDSVPAVDTDPGEAASMVQVEYDVQDVAALLKLRRYMSQSEWDDYVSGMLESIDEDKQAAVQRKYDEADGIYQICISELLQQVHESLDEEAEGAEEEVEEKEKAQSAQENNAEDLHHATEEHSDTVLEQSNNLYLGRISKIRSIQAQTTALETQYASLEALGTITPELEALVEAQFQNPTKDLPERIEAQRTQVKQLLAEAIYFAAEAYISQGAIRHVVAGIQGQKLSDDQKRLPVDQQNVILAQKREAANAKLDFNDLQQSFNEQLGDFLKDFGHLAGKSDGTFYIKASKYVDRMFDVVLILRSRMAADFPVPLNIERQTGKSLDSIVAAIKRLYSARASADIWGAERESTSVAIMLDLGVEARGDLKALLLGLGSEMSALIRNQMPAAADGATERSFFQNRNTAFD